MSFSVVTASHLPSAGDIIRSVSMKVADLRLSSDRISSGCVLCVFRKDTDTPSLIAFFLAPCRSSETVSLKMSVSLDKEKCGQPTGKKNKSNKARKLKSLKRKRRKNKNYERKRKMRKP